MDQLVGTVIAAAVPTLAVVAAFVRNESALASLGGRVETLSREMNSRIETLSRDMSARFETLTRRVDSIDADLREWARITMQHNTDGARLKDKTGLTDQKRSENRICHKFTLDRQNTEAISRRGWQCALKLQHFGHSCCPPGERRRGIVVS